MEKKHYLTTGAKKYKPLFQSFLKAIEMTDHAVIVVDKESRVTVFNRLAEVMMGVSYDEVKGKNIVDVLPNTVLPYILETGEMHKKKKMKLKDKTIFSSRVPIFDGNKIVGAVAIFRDMTEQYNLQEQFDNEKNLREVLDTILETVYDGICVVDKEGYITMISKVYAKFLGVKEEDAIGKHVSDVIENSRMHIVAKTGVAEYADVQKIKGNYMIATRVPIIKDGEVVGAVGKVLFRNIEEFNSLQKRLGNMEKEIEQYKGEIKQINKAKYSFNSIIGNSKELIETKRNALRAAQTDSNVLLVGESGTGKELFAHAIHQSSGRTYGPFVKVNCAAIPSDLLESELFGYEEGAFTGAKKGGKLGKFELADGGTIFLDEIGDMPLSMQAKLLRVIQEREVERVGGTNSRHVNVRIIAATNKNLEEMAAKGEYREDLYYRLNVFLINIPPLRKRREDITALAYHFLNSLCRKYHKDLDDISSDAIKYLSKYEWPGNIRELSNVIERAVNIVDTERAIGTIHLPQKIVGINPGKNMRSLQETLNEAEKHAIIDALRLTGGNKVKAAKVLDISRSTFYEKLIKFNIGE